MSPRSFTNRPNYERVHRADRLRNNVLVQAPEHVRLGCGHEAIAHPVASGPGAQRYFVCPRGCGLEQGRRIR